MFTCLVIIAVQQTRRISTRQRVNSVMAVLYRLTVDAVKLHLFPVLVEFATTWSLKVDEFASVFLVSSLTSNSTLQ